MSTKLATLSCVLALGAGFAPGARAVGPLAYEVHTETGEPREMGTAISDGHTVFSVAWCSTIYTTACDASISYGSPVSEPSPTSVIVPSSVSTSDDFYPVPTTGGSSETSSEQQPGTSSAGSSTSTYGEPTASTSEGAGPSSPTGTHAASTGHSSDVVSGTETTGYGTGTGTATGTSDSGTPTAAGATIGIWKAPILGAAVLAAFFLA